MQLLYGGEWAAIVFREEVFVDYSGRAFGAEVEEVQQVGVDERLDQAHHLVDEGHGVHDVDLLQTTRVGVLQILRFFVKTLNTPKLAFFNLFNSILM